MSSKATEFELARYDVEVYLVNQNPHQINL